MVEPDDAAELFELGLVQFEDLLRVEGVGELIEAPAAEAVHEVHLEGREPRRFERRFLKLGDVESGRE